MSSERTVSFKGIFDCYFRIFPMVKVGFTPEGITIQQRNERILASTFIPAKSFNEYNCEESLVVTLPKDLKKFLVMLSTKNELMIEISRRDSWWVEVTTIFDESACHILRHTRHQLEPISEMKGGISFNKYPAIKHLITDDREIEISESNVVASFRIKNNIISTDIGDARVPYCSVSGKWLSLFNKFLGAKINCSMIEFLKKDNKLAFFIDRDRYKMVIELTTE